jgi:HK97 gp10 family phage protein
MTFDEFAGMLERAAAKTRPELNMTLFQLGPIVAEAAKAMIGHEHESWPPLKPKTLEDKERKGFEIPDPLLRTGKLRESIIAVIEGLTLAVGSADKVAVYQEHGTSRMPPRPFLQPAMVDSLPAAHKLITETAEKILTGK